MPELAPSGVIFVAAVVASDHSVIALWEKLSRTSQFNPRQPP